MLIEEAEGALWSRAMLTAALLDGPAPELDRIVVAVDPPVTGGAKSDTCGIVVAGVTMSGPPQDWRAVVLEDASVEGLAPCLGAGGDRGDGPA